MAKIRCPECASSFSVPIANKSSVVCPKCRASFSPTGPSESDQPAAKSAAAPTKAFLSACPICEKGPVRRKGKGDAPQFACTSCSSVMKKTGEEYVYTSIDDAYSGEKGDLLEDPLTRDDLELLVEEAGGKMGNEADGEEAIEAGPIKLAGVAETVEKPKKGKAAGPIKLGGVAEVVEKPKKEEAAGPIKLAGLVEVVDKPKKEEAAGPIKLAAVAETVEKPKTPKTPKKEEAGGIIELTDVAEVADKPKREGGGPIKLAGLAEVVEKPEKEKPAGPIKLAGVVEVVDQAVDAGKPKAAPKEGAVLDDILAEETGAPSKPKPKAAPTRPAAKPATAPGDASPPQAAQPAAKPKPKPKTKAKPRPKQQKAPLVWALAEPDSPAAPSPKSQPEAKPKAPPKAPPEQQPPPPPPPVAKEAPAPAPPVEEAPEPEPAVDLVAELVAETPEPVATPEPEVEIPAPVAPAPMPPPIEQPAISEPVGAPVQLSMPNLLGLVILFVAAFCVLRATQGVYTQLERQEDRPVVAISAAVQNWKADLAPSASDKGFVGRLIAATQGLVERNRSGYDAVVLFLIVLLLAARLIRTGTVLTYLHAESPTRDERSPRGTLVSMLLLFLYGAAVYAVALSIGTKEPTGAPMALTCSLVLGAVWMYHARLQVPSIERKRLAALPILSMSNVLFAILVYISACGLEVKGWSLLDHYRPAEVAALLMLLNCIVNYQLTPSSELPEGKHDARSMAGIVIGAIVALVLYR